MIVLVKWKIFLVFYKSCRWKFFDTLIFFYKNVQIKNMKQQRKSKKYQRASVPKRKLNFVHYSKFHTEKFLSFVVKHVFIKFVKNYPFSIIIKLKKNALKLPPLTLSSHSTVLELLKKIFIINISLITTPIYIFA